MSKDYYKRLPDGTTEKWTTIKMQQSFSMPYEASRNAHDIHMQDIMNSIMRQPAVMFALKDGAKIEFSTVKDYMHDRTIIHTIMSLPERTLVYMKLAYDEFFCNYE